MNEIFGEVYDISGYGRMLLLIIIAGCPEYIYGTFVNSPLLKPDYDETSD